MTTGAPDRAILTAEPDWAAPVARGPLDATVVLPGSKSLTNRYLVLAALATERSRLRAPLRSRDTLLMADALRSLGVRIDDVAAEGESVAGEVPDWVVTPPETLTGDVSIDCGLAGTVMRFLPAVAALADGPVRLDGDPQARVRPMGPVIDALRVLGADLDDDAGHLPVTVNGRGRVTGGAVTMDASASSQFISALLLAGARYDEGVTVHHDGKPVPSEPHILMTVETLRDAGAIVDDSEPNTVARRAVRDQRPRRVGRAGPLQRRALRRRGPRRGRHGARAGVAAAHHPGR